MNKNEKLLILKIKSRIFEEFDIYPEDMTDKNQYFEPLINIMKEELHVQNVHFFINKKILKDDELVILSDPYDHVTFYDDLMEDTYLSSVNPDKPVFIKNRKKSSVTYEKQLLLKYQDDPVGIVLLECKHHLDEFSQAFCEEISEIIVLFFKKIFKVLIINHDKKRYQLLQNVTNQLHSSMDINLVLRTVFESLAEVYPSFQSSMLLSNADHGIEGLPVEPLDYKSDNSSAMDVFLTGEYRIVDDRESKKSLMYFPLKGKQGIYGVLEIKANQSVTVSNKDIEFICMLAQTASSAMEKAHLYLQSKYLVKDLQLIAKITKKLNANLRLADLVYYIVEELQQSLSADEVGIVFYEGAEMKVLPGSSGYFQQEDCTRLLRYAKKFLDTKEQSIFIGNFEQEENNLNIPYRSIMAEPLKQDSNHIGFIIALNKIPYFFSFDILNYFNH